jgi:hypothetical protein
VKAFLYVLMGLSLLVFVMATLGGVVVLTKAETVLQEGVALDMMTLGALALVGATVAGAGAAVVSALERGASGPVAPQPYGYAPR